MFRLLVEDQENFFRDIEIRADQTFEDLHHFILKTSGIEERELASFHLCDNKWNRKKEITLMDMFQNSDEAKRSTKTETPDIMDECVLKDYLTKPKERLIYEYNYLNPQVFFLELVSIFRTEADHQYPRLKRSNGVLEIKDNAFNPVEGDDLSEQLLKNFNNILKGNFDDDD